MKDFDPAEMDKAASDAKKELMDIDNETVKVMSDWWSRWYLKAGHKRLGRTLVAIGAFMNDE